MYILCHLSRNMITLASKNCIRVQIIISTMAIRVPITLIIFLFRKYYANRLLNKCTSI